MQACFKNLTRAGASLERKLQLVAECQSSEASRKDTEASQIALPITSDVSSSQFLDC